MSKNQTPVPPAFTGDELHCLLPNSSESPGEAGGPAGKRLLIVDDQSEIRTLLVRYLSRQGFECAEAGSGAEALGYLNSSSFGAMLSDIRMPAVGGLDLLRLAKEQDRDLAVLMITANQDIKDGVGAMKLGADDYILKPFNFEEVSISLARALEKRQLKLQIREYQTNLEGMVTNRTVQIQRLFVNVIQSLIFALEAKDRYTDGHSRRVSWLAMLLGKESGLSPRELEVLQVGAMFHDLGKIGIQESVLLKDGPLTDEEYDHIKIHPEIGVRILKPMKEFYEILPLVRHHHERFDGDGYPLGLYSQDIPLGARIIAVADTFDAVTSARPYRLALPVSEAISRLHRAGGSQLDPILVERFIPFAEDTEIQQILYSGNWTSGGRSPSEQSPYRSSPHSYGELIHYCGA